MASNTYEILAGLLRAGIALIVLIFVIVLYNNPPVEEPVVERQIVQPVEPTLIEREWYPNMTPSITFENSNGEVKGRNWIY